MCWMQTYTGKKFYPFDPNPSMICVQDIAHALSLTNRFGGHTIRPYSVAQHCVIACSEGIRQRPGDRLALLCLLHDAAEAYLGDVVRPVKCGLEEFPDMEARVMDCIYKALKVPPPSEEEEAMVKEIDNRLVVTEARDLLASPPIDDWVKDVGADPFPFQIKVWDAEQAKALWLGVFYLIEGTGDEPLRRGSGDGPGTHGMEELQAASVPG